MSAANFSNGSLVVALSMLVCSMSANAQLQCKVTEQPLGGLQGMPAVMHHECPGASGGDEKLNVTFARLNEVIISNILMNEKLPELERVLPGATVVEDELTADLRGLIKGYALKVTEPESNVTFTINVKKPTDKASWQSASLPAVPSGAPDGERRMWSLSGPFGNDSARFDIFLADADQKIWKTSQWPDGLKHFYTCTNAPIACINMWGFLPAERLDAIENDTKKMVEQKEKQNGNMDAEPARAERDWSTGSHAFAQHFKWFRHVAQGAAWPREFLMITADSDECDGFFEFHYHPRSLSVDVAIIENKGDAPVKVADLIGTRRGTPTRLTTLEDEAGSEAPRRLQSAGFVIPPHARVVLPLRAEFLPYEPAWANARSLAQAQQMYKRIKAQRNGQVFQRVIWENDPSKKSPQKQTIRKTRDSFQQPEIPTLRPIVWGPHTRLTGFVIDGKATDMGVSGQNEIQLTRFPISEDNKSQPDEAVDTPKTQLVLHENLQPGRSCPILYSWNGDALEWTRHRKVIDFAQGVDKEGTDRVAVAPGRLKFRIAEEEAEVAMIRDVRLHLVMKDGREMALRPKGAPMPRSTYQSIPAFTHRDFEFALPETIAGSDIASAFIDITGHYRRYSAVLAGR